MAKTSSSEKLRALVEKMEKQKTEDAGAVKKAADSLNKMSAEAKKVGKTLKGESD